MTRKRFIKLAMSNGVQRNKAEKLARLVSACDSYEDLYRLKLCEFSFERMRIALQGIADGIFQIWRPIGETIAAAFNGINWQEVLKEYGKMERSQL